MFYPATGGSISNNPGAYTIVNNFENITLSNGRDEQRFKGLLEQVLADSVRNLSLNIR